MKKGGYISEAEFNSIIDYLMLNPDTLFTAHELAKMLNKKGKSSIISLSNLLKNFASSSSNDIVVVYPPTLFPLFFMYSPRCAKILRVHEEISYKVPCHENIIKLKCKRRECPKYVFYSRVRKISK